LWEIYFKSISQAPKNGVLGSNISQRSKQR
jgi:hypothetical protein